MKIDMLKRLKADIHISKEKITLGGHAFEIEIASQEINTVEKNISTYQLMADHNYILAPNVFTLVYAEMAKIDCDTRKDWKSHLEYWTTSYRIHPLMH